MKPHLFYSILITEILSFPALLKREDCPPNTVLTAYKAADEKVHYICTAYQKPTYEEVVCPSGTIKTATLNNTDYYCEPLHPNALMACEKGMILTAHVEQGRSGYVCKGLKENQDDAAVTKCETGFVLGQAMGKDGKLQTLCVKDTTNTPNISKTNPTPPKVDVPVVKTEPTPSPPKVDVPVAKTDPTPPKVDVPVVKADPAPPKVDVPVVKADPTPPKVDVPVVKADPTPPKVDVPVVKADPTPPKVEVPVVKTEPTPPKVDTPASKLSTPPIKNETTTSKVDSTLPKVDASVAKPAVKPDKLDFRKDPCPFGQRLLKSYDDKKNEMLSCVDVKTIDQQTKIAADGSLVKEVPKPMTIRVVKPPIQVVNSNLEPGEVRSRLVVKTKVIQ